jgi:parallel beta-helix repeat protein
MKELGFKLLAVMECTAENQRTSLPRKGGQSMKRTFATFLGLAMATFFLLQQPIAAWGLIIGTNETRILTQNLAESVVIVGNGATLDCNFFSIVGPGMRPDPPPDNLRIGILVEGRSQVNVRNCFVTGFDKGFRIVGSSNCNFTNNQVFNNSEEGFDVVGSGPANFFVFNTVFNNTRDGFDLDNSHGNTLTGNVVTGNICNGIELDFSNNNIIVGNTVIGNGTADRCRTQQDNMVTFERRSGISLDSSSGNTFTANISNNNGREGFRLQDGSNFNTFENNQASGNRRSDFLQQNSRRNDDRGGNSFVVPFINGD